MFLGMCSHQEHSLNLGGNLEPNLERVIPLPFKCDSVTIDNDQLIKYDLSENDMVLSVQQLFS